MPDQRDGPERHHRAIETNPFDMFSLGLRRTAEGGPADYRGRPQGDPALCRRSFDDAFARREPRHPPDHAVTVNALLLEVFGRADHLGLADFVEAHARIVKSRSRRIERYLRPHPDPLAHEAAGAFAGECVRLRLVAIERAAEGAANVRLLDREMQFAIQGRKAVRLRGLTPAEQDRRDREARTAARRNDRLDREARAAAAPLIGGLLNALVEHDRGFAVPRSWHLAGFLPEALVGLSVAESAGFIVEYHHVADFDRVRLAQWHACLAGAVRQAVGARAAASGPSPFGSAAIEPDDEAALMWLVPAKDT